MRNICIFISVLLMSFTVHGETKKETLGDFLAEVYEETKPVEGSALSQITEQLQNHLPTCPLETDSAVEESEFLEAVSCDRLMSRAKASSLSRFKMHSFIVKLEEEGTIDEAHQAELLASLERNYEPESPQKTKEREQLISHFQNCDPNYSWMDAAKFWSEAFGCKEIIETAHEAGIAYSDVQDAIDAALPAEDGATQAGNDGTTQAGDDGDDTTQAGNDGTTQAGDDGDDTTQAEVLEEPKKRKKSKP